jgi:isochorismate synthase
MNKPHSTSKLRAKVFASDHEDLLAAFARACPKAACFYRRGPDGSELLGIGAVNFGASNEPSTTFSTRFGQLRQRLDNIDGARSEIELLGWTAFSPSDQQTEPQNAASALPDWNAFSRRTLFVPQILVRRRPSRAGTEAVVLAPSAQVDSVWQRWERVLSPPTDLGPCSREPYDVSWLDCDRFRDGVREVTDEKVAPKVVLARRALVHASSPIAAYPVLRNLAEAYPSCSVFAISPSVDAPYPLFVGATPETLSRVEGGTVETMALAGTAQTGEGERPDEAADDALLSSQKDLDEQKFVLDMIVDALEPICQTVSAEPEPHLHRLANVSHLMTRISGRLSDQLGLADVVDALHPTPAVCGTPRKLARRLIGQMERFDRGLYAGALGWMDLDGNGAFDVAIRCGLIDQADALLYAGAGITAASDIDVELTETRNKFEPLLNAISGVKS